jgi:hypothetical protein
VINRLNKYATYSIACGLVWVVILTGVGLAASTSKFHTFALVAGGWAIGWLSATIGRSAYPPPKSRPEPPR